MMVILSTRILYFAIIPILSSEMIVIENFVKICHPWHNWHLRREVSALEEPVWGCRWGTAHFPNFQGKETKNTNFKIHFYIKLNDAKIFSNDVNFECLRDLGYLCHSWHLILCLMSKMKNTSYDVKYLVQLYNNELNWAILHKVG